MKQMGFGTATGVHALECTIAAAVALFAADTIRAALAPIWATLELLFGF